MLEHVPEHGGEQPVPARVPRGGAGGAGAARVQVVRHDDVHLRGQGVQQATVSRSNSQQSQRCSAHLLTVQQQLNAIYIVLYNTVFITMFPHPLRTFPPGPALFILVLLVRQVVIDVSESM